MSGSFNSWLNSKLSFLYFPLVFVFLCLLSLSSLQAQTTVLWQENWEGNWFQDWFVEAGTWEVGVPTSGPDTAFADLNVAATVLAGNYDEPVDSRLIRFTSFIVPPASENPRLRFWHWYSFAAADNGEVQISTDGGATWTPISSTYTWTGSGVWTYPSIDLSAYSDSTVQIAFDFHSATQSGTKDLSSGWYIDEVAVITGPIVFRNPEKFENGTLGDWAVERGTWEIGKPTSGPDSCYSPPNCAGTVLQGNYDEPVDSRLISPPFVVPSANPGLQFWHWFSFASADNGEVQLRVGDGPWESISAPFTNTSSNAWTPFFIPLTAYADSIVQIAFEFHSATQSGSKDLSTGWYIDDITILPIDTSVSKLAGDVDLNRAVEKHDAVSVLQYLVGSTTLSGQQLLNANVSPDATISPWDASVILQRVAGSIDTLPHANVEEATGTITMTDMEVMGDQAEVPLKLTNESNIYGFQMAVLYDPSDLEFQSAVWADAFASFTPQVHNDSDSGILRFAGADSLPVNDAPFLARLLFTVKDISIIDTTFVTLDSLRWNEGPFIDPDAESELITDVDEPGNRIDLSIPKTFSLHQNYPNPFNPTTLIRYELPKATDVKIDVYNIVGQRVAELVNGRQQAGVHEVSFDASSLSTGVYLYRIQTAEFQQIRKMLLTK